MKLYAIRHGLTDLNVKGIYNGLIDEDINETGIAQAHETKELMKDNEYDIIYCSPMLRAKHTCEIINEDNKPVIYDDRLKERTLGKFDGIKTSDGGLSRKDWLSYSYKSDDETFENLPTFFNKIHNFLDEIIEKNKGKNILIVAHGGILRAIYFYFNEIPKDGDVSIYLAKNCEINYYEI